MMFKSRPIAVFLLVSASLGAFARPALAADAVPIDPLRQFSESVEALVKRVSPSVVQVLVTGYGPVDASGRTELVIGRQHSLGSGVIIDSDGYIVTNAHVVAGGQRVEVVLPGDSSDHVPARSMVIARGRTVEGRVIGVAPEIDLALIKVDVTGLAALPIADYDLVRQGELVFAFGSPEGLRNSVTMGVVSAVARQPDDDHPMVYIQTDAPINHGNSGGPLVNVHGELVGINAFILSESGGSQGLGFAIPSAVVNVAYPQLRTYGHLHRGEIGVDLQTITPDLAGGLGLSRDSGVLVSDLAPDGPAAAAGMKVQDIILSIDGRAMESLPLMAFEMFTKNAGDHLNIAVLRGNEQLVLQVDVGERTDELDRLADRVDPEEGLIRELGVLGVAIDPAINAMLPDLRFPSGVVVAARVEDATAAAPLLVGDVIHAVNGVAVSTLPQLRGALTELKPRSAVVLQVERAGKFTFVAFELD